MPAIVGWLTQKIGATLGPAIFWILEKLFYNAVAKAKNYFEKKHREQEQKKALEKVNADIESGAPRNDETRKNEKDLLNS